MSNLPAAQDIETQLDQDHAPAWRPNPGDKLAGEVVALAEYDAGYGPYPIVTVRQDDGEERAVHAFHGVLASELAKHKPQVGDKLAIKYVGQVASETSRRPYHSYKVASSRLQQGSVDWSRYSDESDIAEPPAEPDVPLEPTPVEEHEEGDNDVPF